MRVTRLQRTRARREWDEAFWLELAGARRRAITTVIMAIVERGETPTLRDLLIHVGEDGLDLIQTPAAGKVRLGDLLGVDGEGPFVGDLLEGLGIDPADVERSAQVLGLDVGRELAEFMVW